MFTPNTELYAIFDRAVQENPGIDRDALEQLARCELKNNAALQRRVVVAEIEKALTIVCAIMDREQAGRDLDPPTIARDIIEQHREEYDALSAAERHDAYKELIAEISEHIEVQKVDLPTNDVRE